MFIYPVVDLVWPRVVIMVTVSLTKINVKALFSFSRLDQNINREICKVAEKRKEYPKQIVHLLETKYAAEYKILVRFVYLWDECHCHSIMVLWLLLLLHEPETVSILRSLGFG